MKETYILVPRNLIFEQTIEFITTFKEKNEVCKYIFDFKDMRRIDPFSLLLLSSELSYFKENNPECTFIARNYSHCTYAAHMGFFQAFGLDYGNFPGVANRNERYIPMTLFDVQDIKQTARDLMVNPGEVLDDFAKDISNVLTQNHNPTLAEILQYSIREILRNIVEHSESLDFGFCAQYLPSLDRVSFAVLDRGIGIKESLSLNPRLTLNNHEEAIRESLKPGISGKTYPGQKKKQKGDWANSGFGLYMTSNICKSGGSFFVASGDTGIYLTDQDEKLLDIKIEGTALNLTLNLEQPIELDKILKELRSLAGSDSSIRASNSTMNKSKTAANRR